MAGDLLYVDTVGFERWQFVVLSSEKGVRWLDLHGTPPEEIAARLGARLLSGGKRDVVVQLSEYLSGGRREFSLPLDLRGTAFQLAVWRELLKIPYGKTSFYGEIAARIGRPNAARAVGAAIGANPVPVIVPCHRVIGKNGDLVGFGGGIDLKRRLLALEGVILD
jgi:O-6-methylguanine DNA methyltransferase